VVDKEAALEAEAGALDAVEDGGVFNGIWVLQTQY